MKFQTRLFSFSFFFVFFKHWIEATKKIRENFFRSPLIPIVSTIPTNFFKIIFFLTFSCGTNVKLFALVKVNRILKWITILQFDIPLKIIMTQYFLITWFSVIPFSWIQLLVTNISLIINLSFVPDRTNSTLVYLDPLCSNAMTCK